jgi:hypothetical protein
VPGGTREAGRLHPANLVLDGIDKARIDDHVIDCVMTEYHGFTQLKSLVAEHEIVGAIVCCDFEAAHVANGLAAKGHGGAENKLHAFHEPGGENA